MKHIVIVIDQLQSGGAPVVVKTLAKTLRDLGHHVTLMSLSEKVGDEVPGVDQLILPQKTRGILSRWFRYSTHARKLDNILDSHQRIDLILAHLHYSHQVVSRSKYIDRTWFCIHSNPAIELLGNTHGFSRLLKMYKIKKLYSKKNIIGVSKGIVNALKESLKIKPNRALTIYNPVDYNRILSNANERDELINEPYLLFVGRISMRSKRYDRLLEAYKLSGTVLPLVIVGGGELEQIKTQISIMNLQDKVILIGPHNNPYRFMKHATALLLSSDYEGLPTVIIESFVCGTPVVSTNCPSGPSELLIDEQEDFLVPLDDINAFAKAINRIIKTPPQIPLALLDKFKPSNVANQYIMLCKER